MQKNMSRLTLTNRAATASVYPGHATPLSHWSSVVIALTVISVYYLLLLSNGSFQLFGSEMLDKAFDNMLAHLLHGEVTVDREAIGFEAFTRDGKTYAYFGVFPAVLRLFVMPFANIADIHLARLSCLTALVIFVGFQLRMLLIVHSSVPVINRRPEFFMLMFAATLLSGPQIYILGSASIYHEPILWSAAMAAAFNLIIVQAVFGTKTLRVRDFSFLATLSGLAINTRPSVGSGLYFATVLLIVWTAWCEAVRDHRLQQSLGEAMRVWLALLPPTLILFLAATLAGIINFKRWGSAFTFADFQYYDMRLNVYPSLRKVLKTYGEFNVSRIWIGVLYYGTGLPYLLKAVPPFADFLRARYQTIEAPPITPVLTNPLTIILAVVGLYRVWWKPILTERLIILRLALLGHAAILLLILAAMGYTLRYRFDFAPFMTLAALVGYSSVSVSVSQAPGAWQKRVRIAAIALCVIGIVSSHYVLVMHKVWSIAVPMQVRLALRPFAPFPYHTLGR
jgi:hypothetical protein